jgi:hypothetical protein
MNTCLNQNLKAKPEPLTSVSSAATARGHSMLLPYYVYGGPQKRPTLKWTFLNNGMF